MIKLEPVTNNDGSATFLYNSNEETHQQEVKGIQMEIKQEHELILEPDDEWLPSKIEDEQQEYYHQYQHNDNNDEGDDVFILPTIKPEPEFEEYSIEYLDEEDDSNSNDYEYNKYNYEHDIDDENEDSESSDNDMDQSGYMESIEQPGYCNEEKDTTEDTVYNLLEDSSNRSNSETVCKNTFLKWLCGNYIQHMCPICNNKFKQYRPWSQHINQQHQDMIEDAKTNFHINEKSRAICKLCSKQFNMDFQILIHSLRHASQQHTVKFFTCNICQFESTKSIYVQHHIMERHPHIEQIFKKLKIEPKKKVYECPLCLSKYQKYNHIRYHFLDNHQKEFFEKFKYKCHLCEGKTKFIIEEEFYKHLLDEHNLNDLKLLNFIKLSGNPEEHYYSCTKCFKIFTELNFMKLLKHSLEHDAKSYWLCKYCTKKISFRYHSYYHVCPKMVKIYNKRIVISKTEEENPTPSSSASYINLEKKKVSNWKESPASLHIKQEKKKLSNWQEFEDYIIHICSFCNMQFDTLQRWQMHLRKLHQIDTLKGLEMETIADNPNKLQCQVCNTLVINTSIQLHTHRFQHLPYKPYKCRHCDKTLNNYSIALTHVLNQCQDNKDLVKFKGLVVLGPNAAIKTIRESLEISCSFCQNQKFEDVQSILQHFEDKHTNFLEFFCHQPDNSMICNLCEHQFAVYNKKICISHIIQHLDEKTYKCLLCPQTYHTYKVCLSHVKRSHFAQAINTQKTIDKSLKSSHLQKAHPVTKARMACITDKSLTLNEFLEFINFACPECNESFVNQELWHDHINNTHNFFDIDNLGTEDPSDGLLKCQDCKLKLTNSLVQQQKHKLTHMPHRSFICNLCYHRCTTLGVLYGHLRRLHFNKGSYKCPICSVVSITSYERSEHIKKNHPQSEWPVTMCLVCYKTLASRKGLTTHMITHDINRQKFECKYCSAKLCDMKDLKIHVARHEKNMEQTGESDQNNYDDDDNSKTPIIDITETITNDVEQEHNIDADDHKQNEATVHSIFNNSTNNNTEAEKLIEHDKINEILNTDDVKVEIITTSKSDNRDNKNMITVKKRKLILNSVKIKNKSNAKRKNIK